MCTVNCIYHVLCNLCLPGISCGPPDVANSTVVALTYLFGDVAAFTCNQGYRMADNLTTANITCQADKTWSTPLMCACMLCDDISNLHSCKLYLKIFANNSICGSENIFVRQLRVITFEFQVFLCAIIAMKFKCLISCSKHFE